MNNLSGTFTVFTPGAFVAEAQGTALAEAVDFRQRMNSFPSAYN